MDCIFCKIAEKEIPSEIFYEDEKIIAFKDIQPIAPVHILIIPKKHIQSVNQIENEDRSLIADLLIAARIITEKYGIKENGYRLIFNVGKDAGQTVEHLHLHLIGGKQLSWP